MRRRTAAAKGLPRADAPVWATSSMAGTDASLLRNTRWPQSATYCRSTSIYKVGPSIDGLWRSPTR